MVQLGPHPSLAKRLFFRTHAVLSRFAGAITFNSRRAADEHRRHGYPAKRIIIPNGFDTGRYKPDRELRQDMRGRLGLSDDRIVVGSIGRFHRDKDHLTFLTAAAIAARGNPKLVFLLAGTRTETIPLDPALSPLIAQIGVERVRLLGHFGDMPRLYNALDLCVLSSTAEGFPNVMGEAMACGVACISTDVGDVRTLIGDTGIVCPPSQPESLAQAILSMAAEDRAPLGDAARDRIRDNFSIAQVHEQFAHVWAQCGA